MKTKSITLVSPLTAFAVAMIAMAAAFLSPSVFAFAPPSPPAPPPPWTANLVTEQLQQQEGIAALDETLFGTESATEYFAGEIESIQVSIQIIGEYGINGYSLQLVNQEQLYYIMAYGFSGPNGAFWQGVSQGFALAESDLAAAGDGVYE